MKFPDIIKKLIRLMIREKIHRIFLFIAAVMVSGSLVITFFEEQLKLKDAFWWSIVTMSTVGYGDISPATPGGRITAMIVMLLGIGLLGVLTASIASIFVETRLLENRGMKAADVKDHYIICGWNFRGNIIVEELRADEKSREAPVVVLADLPEKPIDDPLLHFIRGEVEEERLKRANLDKARAVILLSDDRLDAYAGDAKTILSVMTVKNAAPGLYTCVELKDPRNESHCIMAKADEIVIAGELSTNMLVQAALDHGITRIISELVSNRYGNEIFKIPLPEGYAGKTFFDVMTRLKKEHNIICLGVEDRAGKKVVANPDNNHLLGEEDDLIVIAEERPEI